MKAAVINFFKQDKVQITLIITFLCVMVFGFVVTFVVTAFPKDPAIEEMHRQAEIRDAEYAKWYKELKEKNGWDD